MGEAVSLDVTRLGRYQILKHLATGGMAEVLLAHAQGPFGSDHVVIKRVRRDQAGDPEFVKMFMDEATLAASLQHPNIVRVHEIGADQGEYFFAMEYIHGEDLRRVLMEVNRRRDKLPIALVTGIVAAAAAGLDHAHNQRGPNGEALGIVHRDVSPANILVGYDGQVKVADFGIAKAALRSVETQTGTLKGKVSYMSPEQVTGRPVDRRSDVYALGIVLYEVVTARRLFKGDNDFLTMSSIVQGDIPLPSIHRPDLPRILEDIVMKALSPNAKDRYQSAEELRAELEKFTLAIGMRMSNESIADYMRKLFGVRAQPWLTDSEPTHTTTIDFDGSASGLVQHNVAAAAKKAFERSGPSNNSPIAMSHRAATPQPVAQTNPGAATYPVADSSWVAKPPTGTGSGQPLAWSQQQPPASRRRFGIVLGMAGVAVIAGVIILVTSMKGGDSESREVAAAPPTAEPTVVIGEQPKDEPKDEPTTPDKAVAEPVGPTKAETAAAAKAAADAKAEAAATAAADAKAAKLEAARLAKSEAAEKAETAAKSAAEAKAAKAEAARLAKAERAEKAELAAKSASAARAEKAEAARLAKAEKAEKAEAARLAKAEQAASAPKVEKVAATRPKPASVAAKPTKPAVKPAAKTEQQWDPNSLFPK